MKWLDKLERKVGHLGIPNLMAYIVGANAFVYILMYMDPTGMIQEHLMLYPNLVMQGQVWRLLTYVFIPPARSVFWILFTLYFYYMVGTGLEQEWGTFRFNLYYLVGMIGTTAAAFITGTGATAIYLNLSLFLAFARIYPDFQLLLFFVIPVKMKYLAWLNWFFIGVTVVSGGMGAKIAAVVSIVNYFLFFGKDIINRTKTSRQVYANRKRFRSELPQNKTIHKCTICGITEKDNPQIEFRYCSKCYGYHEYCMDHLKDHTHIENQLEQE